MFIGFFYLLKLRGFGVSLTEWESLLQGLLFGLHRSSLTGFYNLCRAVLVKSEADYDKFDRIFLEYFKDVPYQEDLPEELLSWLEKPQEVLDAFRAFLVDQGYEPKEIEEIIKSFEERLKEQTEEHNGGSYWIGTGGFSNFGHSGHSPQGIRVGGVSRYRHAFQVAGERRFRDFRTDNVLDIRQFQMAFRLLRQYSDQLPDQEPEFDIDGTIRATADNAGVLKVKYKKPRTNTVKLLMLMDSGGSMEYYSRLCSQLFQAAESSNHFKELHIYYFHNCVYGNLYSDPRLSWSRRVPTDWVLKNYGSEYKLIMVGDALMDMYELKGNGYGYYYDKQEKSGWEQLKRLRKQYEHSVWLNPEEPPLPGGYWGQSYYHIAGIFPMFRLSLEGLKEAMHALLVQR